MKQEPLDKEEYDDSLEPMDVDMSATSSKYSKNISQVNVSDFDDNTIDLTSSDNELPDDIPTNVKKLHVNLVPTKKSFKIPIRTIIAVTVISAVIVTKCLPICCIINVANIKNLLNTKVYGQNDSIEKLLRTFRAEEKQKVTFILGPTGVGKTYSMNIIMEAYGNASNIHFATPATIKSDLSSMKTLLPCYFCSFNLIIVDNMSIDDTEVFDIVKQMITKSKSLQKKLHIILIFNSDITDENLSKTDDYGIETRLKEIFKDVYKTVIKYKRLSKENLLQCIEFSIKMYSKNELYQPQNFVKFFNVERDGCKGVDAKIKGIHKL